MADDPSQREMLEQLEFGSRDRPGHLGGYDQQPIQCRYGPQLTISPIEQMANRSEPLMLVVNLETAESNSMSPHKQHVLERYASPRSDNDHIASLDQPTLDAGTPSMFRPGCPYPKHDVEPASAGDDLLWTMTSRHIH